MSLFQVTPTTAAPADIENARLAERIMNTPAFVDSYRAAWREAVRRFAHGETLTPADLDDIARRTLHAHMSNDVPNEDQR